jgi:dipeptidase
MRDSYQGTQFDITAQDAFKIGAQTSALACPWAPPELLELLGLEPERTLCTPTSGYVFVSQLRSNLPPSIGNLLWFAYGPANTSCFIPLYAGTIDLPDTWDHPANFSRIDRAQAQWNFRLVHNLTLHLRYQETAPVVRSLIEPLESAYRDLQPALEEAALKVYQHQGREAAESFLTAYAKANATQVGNTYSGLVDHLMLRFLVSNPEFAESGPPQVSLPVIPSSVHVDSP